MNSPDLVGSTNALLNGLNGLFGEYCWGGCFRVLPHMERSGLNCFFCLDMGDARTDCKGLCPNLPNPGKDGFDPNWWLSPVKWKTKCKMLVTSSYFHIIQKITILKVFLKSVSLMHSFKDNLTSRVITSRVGVR